MPGPLGASRLARVEAGEIILNPREQAVVRHMTGDEASRGGMADRPQIIQVYLDGGVIFESQINRINQGIAHGRIIVCGGPK